MQQKKTTLQTIDQKKVSQPTKTQKKVSQKIFWSWHELVKLVWIYPRFFIGLCKKQNMLLCFFFFFVLVVHENKSWWSKTHVYRCTEKRDINKALLKIANDSGLKENVTNNFRLCWPKLVCNLVSEILP